VSIATPNTDKDLMRIEVSSLFISLSQLTEMALIQDFGLSENSIATLLKIDKEKSGLYRTFSWLHT
jgi:hypothetical protein